MILLLMKQSNEFWCNLSGYSMIEKIFDGEVLMRTLTTSLLQIICEITLNPKVIAKSIVNPEDNI